MTNSAQAEIVDVVSTSLADLVGVEFFWVPLFRPLALFITDVALDLKAEAEEQQAERKKQEKETFFAKIGPWKSRDVPRKPPDPSAALANAAQQTTNVVIARGAVGRVSAVRQLGYLMDPATVTKILIKTSAKIEERLEDNWQRRAAERKRRQGQRWRWPGGWW